MFSHPFLLARFPAIDFGAGALLRAVEHAARYGNRLLVVTGKKALDDGGHWERLETHLKSNGLSWQRLRVDGEPSPEQVDAAVRRHRPEAIDAVLAIGGGSVLDAGKAIAGLLPSGASVMDYLEGVGKGIPYQGPATPLIAAPTTAGTGSEATKNAVLSRRGPGGFKKSFRDEQLVAQVAAVDPEVLVSCPPSLLAAEGMDAFTQLLESFCSTKANPMTDALAWSGMVAFVDAFFTVWSGEGQRADRAKLAYASLVSGICLAQTGLGAVHGMASPMGAFFPIPHGVVCGTLLAETTAMNIQALQSRLPDSPALAKYARVGALVSGREVSEAEGLAALVETLRHWQEKLALPRLRAYDVQEQALGPVIQESRGSSMRTNPLPLTDEELWEIVRRRM